MRFQDPFAATQLVLAHGKKAFVEISNKNADGLVFADAVMMVPDFK